MRLIADLQMPTSRSTLRWVAAIAMPLALLLNSVSDARAEAARRLLEIDLGKKVIFVNQYPDIDGRILIVVNLRSGDVASLYRDPLVRMNNNSGGGYFPVLERVTAQDYNKRVFYLFLPMEDLSNTTSIEIDGHRAEWRIR